MQKHHECELRVRYDECDPMGFVHHSNYLRYFEIARTELLRASGGSYRQMEEEGQFVVVVRLSCNYLKPARYDDILSISVDVTKVTHAKIEHAYRVSCEGVDLVRAQVTLAIIDRNGIVCPVPESLRQS